MPTKSKNIVDGFPHPTITPIIGMSTYETIADLHINTNKNSTSVQSNMGDGQLGILPLNVSQDVYNTLLSVAFVAPVNPGSTEVIPPAQTAAHIYNIHREHARSHELFK